MSRTFLDALASLDFKLSVSESVRDVFQLAHLRVFQSYSIRKWKWTFARCGVEDIQAASSLIALRKANITTTIKLVKQKTSDKWIDLSIMPGSSWKSFLATSSISASAITPTLKKKQKMRKKKTNKHIDQKIRKRTLFSTTISMLS